MCTYARHCACMCVNFYVCGSRFESPGAGQNNGTLTHQSERAADDAQRPGRQQTAFQASLYIYPIPLPPPPPTPAMKIIIARSSYHVYLLLLLLLHSPPYSAILQPGRSSKKAQRLIKASLCTKVALSRQETYSIVFFICTYISRAILKYIVSKL